MWLCEWVYSPSRSDKITLLGLISLALAPELWDCITLSMSRKPSNVEGVC